MSAIKNVLRDLVPPALWRAMARARPPTPLPSFDFRGDYPNWAEAVRASSGYAAAEILARTRAAALKVKRGEVAFERDSLVFHQPEFGFPLLSGLTRAAAVDGGRLSVLDFGGSLGSSYFQNRSFLTGLREVRWGVVEQTAHVLCGQSEFSGPELSFHATPADCIAALRPNVLLLSSVLQYLPEPYRLLEELCRMGIANVIIDRTAFWRGARERLTVQTVPAHVYAASYPAWFFFEQRLTAVLGGAGYRILAEIPGTDRVTLESGEAFFKGFICVRS